MNAQTRTIQVTIRIQDSAPKAFPLLPNAFVNVRVLAPATDLVAILRVRCKLTHRFGWLMAILCAFKALSHVTSIATVFTWPKVMR